MACTYPDPFGDCVRGEFDENDVCFCDGCKYDSKNPCSNCDRDSHFCNGCAEWENWFYAESPWA